MPSRIAGSARGIERRRKGWTEHDAQILGQVTNLFLSNVDHLNQSRIAAVDGVLAGLIGQVEAATVIHLGEALSTLDRAPRQTIRIWHFTATRWWLRRSCGKSNCLSDKDLLEIAKPVASSICWRYATEDAQRSADRCVDEVRRRQRLQRACAERRSEFLRVRLRHACGSGGA